MLTGDRFKGLYTSLSGEWRTPQELFDELDKEFHFILDPCGTSTNHKCPYYFAEADGSLNRPWHEYDVVFVNPPYGRGIGKWTQKGLAESILGATVVMLLPARTDTAWWHNYVMRADEIRYIRGRLHFPDKYGLEQGPAPFPSCVVVFRPPHLCRSMQGLKAALNPEGE
jgi:site-specific DNA-methyltransferase (adenine-specific)